MSIDALTGVPLLTLGWRLKMALGHVSVQEMADELGLERSSISRWMNDKGGRPKRAYLAQWALKTGVPLVWLETGNVPSPDPAPGGEWAPSDSNRQPTDCRFLQVRELKTAC